MAQSPASILYDSTGANPIGTINDAGVRRVAVDAKIAPQTGGPPLPIVIQSNYPFNPALFVRKFLLNAGSDNLIANGSVTPVVFSYPADPTKDISVYEMRVIFSASGIPFGANKFGNNNPLTNGLQMAVYSGATEYELANIKVNEDFLSLVPTGQLLVDQTGASDFLTASIVIGSSFILAAGSTDELRVRVRDNLPSLSSMQFLKCVAFGVKAV